MHNHIIDFNGRKNEIFGFREAAKNTLRGDAQVGGEAVEFDQNAGGGGCRRASFIMLEDIVSLHLRGLKKFPSNNKKNSKNIKN